LWKEQIHAGVVATELSRAIPCPQGRAVRGDGGLAVAGHGGERAVNAIVSLRDPDA
jgi:hypothetical protein